MWLFAVFLIVPLIEIALFITVGGWLTLWPTLAIVVLTAMAGSLLVRWQGTQVLRDLSHEMNSLGDPVSPLAHGALVLLGGVMMILPGFFTDALGMALMVPPVRRLVIRLVLSRLPRGRMGGFARAPQGAGTIIDAEFTEAGAEEPPGRPPSGWTKH
ncbi:MAG: FxsA family protein [Paracoccaceae bacterium]